MTQLALSAFSPQWSAAFSPCGLYRYQLTRRWSDGPILAGLGLNPSTADAERNDPTLFKLMAIARHNGFGGLDWGNLFAFRATDAREMWAAADPVGPDNDEWIARIADGKPVLCAWGNGRVSSMLPRLRRRVADVLKLLDPDALRCIKLNVQTGMPVHPLYQPGNARLGLFVEAMMPATVAPTY